MKCPVCGTWTLIKETRKTPDNGKKRRYECANEHRFNTLEKILPQKEVRPKRKAAKNSGGA
jgi:transcriptional regulator NrdR family protein